MKEKFPNATDQVLRAALKDHDSVEEATQFLSQLRKIRVLEQIFGEFSKKSLLTALNKANGDVDMAMSFLKKAREKKSEKKKRKQ